MHHWGRQPWQRPWSPSCGWKHRARRGSAGGAGWAGAWDGSKGGWCVREGDSRKRVTADTKKWGVLSSVTKS